MAQIAHDPSTKNAPHSLTSPTSPNLDRKLGNQQNGKMKTTLDLPDALVKQVKLRALHDGRKLKDAVADLLRKGLAAEASPASEEAVIGKDKKTGLPLILGKKAASPHDEMT